MSSFFGKDLWLPLFILKRIHSDDPSLTRAECLRMMLYGFGSDLAHQLSHGMSDLAHQLSHGMGDKFTLSDHRKPMMFIKRRMASKLMAAMRDKAAKEAEKLCASGQFADAVVPLQFAIDLGDLLSLALKAWLIIRGRDGIKRDIMKAFVLAEEGARLGCHHCQGLMAYHYLEGLVCHKDCARSQELARESAERGSRYGQYALGELLLSGADGLAQDHVQAVVFFRLATEQGLDAAQNRLGCMYSNGQGVDKDIAEALRLFQFAADQGYPDALFNIAFSHEEGEGVAEDVAEAIRWYRRAQAAGCCQATNELLRLGA